MEAKGFFDKTVNRLNFYLIYKAFPIVIKNNKYYKNIIFIIIYYKYIINI